MTDTLFTFRNLMFALIAAGLMSANVAHAGEAGKKPENRASTAQCGGADMMDELAADNPALYRKIKDAAKTSENGRALFWQVSKPGVAPSYLFGTIHLTDPRVTELSQRVKSALKGADVLALEIADLSPSQMAIALVRASKLAIYTDGTSLKSQLSSADFETVKRKLKSAGMPVKTAQVFKPWVVTMLLATSDCERGRIKAGKKILDMQLASLAKKNDVPVIGLETLDQQLEALSASPLEDQLEMLRAGLAYVDRSDDLVETLVQIYLNREIGATWPFQIVLAEKAGVAAQSYDSLRESLVVKRNHRMRDEAMALLEKGNAFIAVGALHLPGEDGLVTLIRKAGFDVTAAE